MPRAQNSKSNGKPSRSADTRSPNGRERRDNGSASAHPIEWAVGVISAILIACLLGYFLYQALSADGKPPALAAVVERVEQVEGAYHVMILLRNDGDETASDVVLDAALSIPEQQEARAQVIFDYVPARSLRRGTFVFTQDPSDGELDIRVVGYSEP